ncbi:uncharacterized protein EV420DRAFT_1548038 [Desarmillaria tabescens]|uniref:Uncharacterized protein n=1 Tax=Armillaria tabescens TaxID=1929756 RepID=A0AA39N4S5_ARMTA|nr:uncharacterized protein EV420DRAFT_1548038 [Desarmillaria tabescens]KAK0457414.1 hypothetical protein EV420DRAFT_1548038 [Desarmillaria tabescens]
MAPHDNASADKENTEAATSPHPSVATHAARAKKVHVISSDSEDSTVAENGPRRVRRKGTSPKKKSKKKTVAPPSDYENDEPSPKKTKRKVKASAASTSVDPPAPPPSKNPPKVITKPAADLATKAMAQLAINLSIDSARKESDLRKRAEAEQQTAQYQAVALERAVVYAERRLQALQIAKDLNLDPKLVGLPADPLTISPPNDTTGKNSAPAAVSTSHTTPPVRPAPTSTMPSAYSGPSGSLSASTSSSIGPQTPVVVPTSYSAGFGTFTPVTPFGAQGAFAPSFSNIPFAGFPATPFAQSASFAQPHPFVQGLAVPSAPVPGPEVTMSDG